MRLPVLLLCCDRRLVRIRHCAILHSVPTANAVAAGIVASTSYQACGSGSSPRRSDFYDVEIMHDHMVACAKFPIMGEQVIELVPVERTNHRVGICRSGGADRVQPLRGGRIVRRLRFGRPPAVMRGGEPV